MAPWLLCLGPYPRRVLAGPAGVSIWFWIFSSDFLPESEGRRFPFSEKRAVQPKSTSDPHWALTTHLSEAINSPALGPSLCGRKSPGAFLSVLDGSARSFGCRNCNPLPANTTPTVLMGPSQDYSGAFAVQSVSPVWVSHKTVSFLPPKAPQGGGVHKCRL